jgi:two-component system, NarL family, invasion response regulator UvrY
MVFVNILSLDKSVREQLEEILKDGGSAQVLQITIHNSVSTALAAISDGATGRWLDSDTLQALIAGMDAAASAGQMIDAEVVEQRVAAQPVDPEISAVLRELSRRELQVLSLVVNGRTSSQIASELHLSPKTIDTYRSRLMQKLNVPDLPRLVRLAIREGVLPED